MAFTLTVNLLTMVVILALDMIDMTEGMCYYSSPGTVKRLA
jgi:hypothetical protein